MTHDLCIHEEQIQGISRKTAELEAKAEYKEKRIDELNTKIERMDNKIDVLLDGFNEFKLQSTEGDTALELRLTTIESEQDNLKGLIKSILENNQQEKEEQQRRFNNAIAVVTIIFVILSFMFNFILK